MSSSHSQPSTEWKQLDIIKYLVLTNFNRVKYSYVDSPKYRQCPLNNETHLLWKNKWIYLEVFITNFQYNHTPLPPAPHNAEILYTIHWKHAGSPAMKPFSVAQSQHFGFNVLLTVHHAMILGNCPAWRTNSFQSIYLFIVLYMFRACHAHNQEKQIVSIELLVIVTPCWWQCHVLVGGKPPTSTRSCIDKICFSWW